MGAVIPDQELTLQDAMFLDLAIFFSQSQTLFDYIMQTNAVLRRVLPTFGEDFDPIFALLCVDVDLTVLAIVLTLNADPPPTRQLAAMLDASGLLKYRLWDHDPGAGRYLLDSCFFEQGLDVLSDSREH
jgi:hypothetical protein